MNQQGMTAAEGRATLSLAAIFSTRMVGLFMILPVFALYAEHLEGVTPTLVGVAIGAYGLTQALLQIPFGMLSDRLGRKPVIAAGLVIFAVGSVVAALAESIWGVIMGRALQGAGAIAAVVMALTADLTREEHRLKAMAIIGLSIGISFSIALVVGPLLNEWIGVPGLFWLTALMSLIGLAVLFLVVPQPQHSRLHRDAQTVPAELKTVITDGQLLRLDFGIFVLHMILTATFVVVPLALRDAGLAPGQHWWVYFLVMILAMAIMVPFIIVAEKRRLMKPVLVGAVLALALAQGGLSVVTGSLWAIIAALFLFFVAFNILEASLPSLVAKMAPADRKGTAMGVYSTSQFLGAFCGGLAGGYLHGAMDLSAVFAAAALVALVWVAVAATMARPRYLTSYLVHVGEVEPDQALALARRMSQVPGVEEAVVVSEEGVAYLKVDSRRLDKQTLEEFSV